MTRVWVLVDGVGDDWHGLHGFVRMGGKWGVIILIRGRFVGSL